MSERGNDTQRRPLGDLLTRITDDAQRLLKAEARLYQAAALHKIALSRGAIALFAVALVLALGAILTLFVMLAFAIQPWLGSAGAGLAVAVAGLAIAALFVRAGMTRLDKVLGEEGEE